MPSQLFATKPHSMLLEELRGENRLRRVLGPVQLSSLGVGAIIGTGIFVLVGIAAHDRTGPALMLSFVAAGVTCIFAALCYAEFASMVPVAGSAYTYAYATLGELFAWIIGWDLILEYAVASSTVAHGWSHYFQDLLAFFQVKLPLIVTNAPFDFDPDQWKARSDGHLVRSARHRHRRAGHRDSGQGDPGKRQLQCRHRDPEGHDRLLRDRLGRALRESSQLAPLRTLRAHWLELVWSHPAWGRRDQRGEPVGMLAGAAIVFFAYIGFDSVSTHAEEARNPSRDVPIGIMVSLVLCTVLYIAMAAVLTGMVPYNQINIDAPVSDAFRQVGLPWAQLLVSIGAVAGITSVLLVMMLSQPRIFLAMARDGLLPPGFFAAVHDRFRTPWKSTILTGFCVATMARLLAFADPGRTGEHRHSAGVRDCLRGRPDHAAHPSRGAPPVPRAVQSHHAHPGNLVLPHPDVLAACRELVAAGRLAGCGPDHLLHLWTQA